MINGIQMVSYLPLVNVPIPKGAATFSGSVTEIITFDIPNLDMETVLSYFDSFQCPDDDAIFTDFL